MDKPNIEEVFTAFQRFQSAQLHTMRAGTPGSWARDMDKVREEFKVELETMGLAQHIDWTDKK